MSGWDRQIEDDLKWREAELGSLKLLLASTEKNTDKQRSLLRALWAMLYAHYEGFSKFCWDLLLAEVERRAIRRSDLTAPFAKLSLESSFSELRGDLSTEALWSFFNYTLPSSMEDPATSMPRLETKSNLWPNVLEDNNARIALSCSQIDTHRTRINAIVARRNDIAHGKKMVIRDVDEYQPYEDAALIVMHDLAVAVVDCLEGSRFAATSTQEENRAGQIGG